MAGWRSLLVSVVLVHFVVLFINITAFFLLPFSCFVLDVPFLWSLLFVVPIQSNIIYLTFNRNPCPLTRLENLARKKLGMREIGGFVGWYILKMKWRKKKGENECKITEQSEKTMSQA